MTDLVERVARVIAETDDNPFPYPKCWRAEARAAIRVVLKEAAKIAEQGPFLEAPTPEMDYASSMIAAAIRALVE